MANIEDKLVDCPVCVGAGIFEIGYFCCGNYDANSNPLCCGKGQVQTEKCTVCNSHGVVTESEAIIIKLKGTKNVRIGS